jgi:branched-chain amino acid aminotransferase
MINKNLDIDPKSFESLKSFELPKDYGFGQHLVPIMLECDYKNGKWEKPLIRPYANLSIDPCSKVFHYAQEIFEGMKAYKNPKGEILLFRPEMNAARFNKSAERMAMPTIDEDLFLDCIEAMVDLSRDFVPSTHGHSLYIRPFMFATEVGIGIKPSDSFKFMVYTSPCESYFAPGDLNVYVETDSVRAVPGGTGHVKTGGNYAAGLQSALKAKSNGFQQVLWLDSTHRKYVEELSGMNFFAIMGDNLCTPQITQTILEGITRSSIIKIYNKYFSNNKNVKEIKINIHDLYESIENEICIEAFACGTASIISPIASLNNYKEEKFSLKYPKGKLGLEIKEKLLNIQEGRDEDPFQWTHIVKNHFTN